MHYPYLMAAIAIFPLLISGCSLRFTDDFETDPLGGSPATYPAGSPEDQLFTLSREPGSSITISNTPHLSGNKSMRMNGPAGQSCPCVYMLAEELDDSSQPVFATWIGALTEGASASVSFFTGHFEPIVTIELEQGNILVADQTIGTYVPGGKHTFFVKADPSDDTYTITAMGDVSVTNPITGAVADPGYFPQRNIGLTFILTHGNSSDYYAVDAVTMSERDPPEG